MTKHVLVGAERMVAELREENDMLRALLSEARYFAAEDFPGAPEVADLLTQEDTMATPRYLAYWKALNKTLGAGNAEKAATTSEGQAVRQAVQRHLQNDGGPAVEQDHAHRGEQASKGV